MATSFDPYVGGGEDLHASGGGGGGSAFETEESYEHHLYTSEEKHRGLDIEDEDDREEKEGGAGGNYGGASLTDGGNHGFDIDLGSEAPPSYRSPFDDDDDDHHDAGYGDAGNLSPSDPFRHQSFESRNHTDFSSPIDNDKFSPSADFNSKGFSSSHGEAFTNSSQVEVSSPFTYPFPSSSTSPLNGSVLPPPEEMEPEEGFVLREWRRKNAIHLEEKATKEREKLSQIIDAADSFKDEFYEKRKMNYEANKNNNRDKEKIFLENLTNFHATADKHYWKAIAELVPHELPSLESKVRGNKDKKKPSVIVNHGPKPGKATDLTRMRQVLVKLKHNPPAHMKPPPPPPTPATTTATTTSPATTVEGSDAKPSLIAAA